MDRQDHPGAQLGRLVTAIGDPAVGLQQCCWAEIAVAIPPVTAGQDVWTSCDTLHIPT